MSLRNDRHSAAFTARPPADRAPNGQIQGMHAPPLAISRAEHEPGTAVLARTMFAAIRGHTRGFPAVDAALRWRKLLAKKPLPLVM
jgi:hypothetical protein